MLNSEDKETLETFNKVFNIRKLQKFYKLRNLIRYSQMSRTTNESVAEHTYYVSLFSRMICTKLGLDADTTLKCVTYALIHDIPEIWTSDVPHPVKEGNPKLSKLLNEVEIDVMKNHCPEFLDDYKEGLNRVDPKVSIIVDLADIVSVLQYANSQVKLGNEYFVKVIIDGLDRYFYCKRELENLFGLEEDSFDLFER